MRQKTRRTIIFISLFLFPITINYFSPYLSIDGAFIGIMSGSVIVFISMFVSALFLRRAWCGWVCPIAGLSELGSTINNKQVSAKKLAVIRHSIFTVWFLILLAGFVLAGGIKGINPLYLTENIISIDEPLKYIIYYLVLLLFFGLTVLIGKRGACHTVCWMSPFLVGGSKMGKALRFPQLIIKTELSKCIQCKACDKKCPMSIPVNEQVKQGKITSSDCILCGECVDVCPKKMLKYGI